ncbi:MAG: NlpC/P60 family protein [Chitinophagaceae bacterium]
MLKKTTGLLFFFFSALVVVTPGCSGFEKKDKPSQIVDSTGGAEHLTDTVDIPPPIPQETVRMSINTGRTTPDSILSFARTLIGVPYLYASTDPAKGFDCSGFITYVFNHFRIAVPRSSVDFTDIGNEVNMEEAMPGDLILFTGTDSTIRVVGHMGIVESRKEDTLYFIHSTSGRNNLGVIITPFERYYRSRFVKIIRIFPEESFD